MRIQAKVDGLERFRAAIEEINAEMLTPKVMETLSEGLKERIAERMAIGKDATGEAFAPYSPGYARRRAGLGKEVGTVTLSLTGAMLGSMNARSDGKDGSVAFGSGKEGEKARYLQVTGAGRQRVKRIFFAMSEADRGWVLKTIGAHVGEVIKKAFRKG